MTKIKQILGNIPQVRVSFYTDNKKPELKPAEGFRVAFLRYKTDKETQELRSSMAIQIRKLSRSNFTSEFYERILEEVQDSALKRCGDSELSIDQCEDGEFLCRDYLETSRSGGKRISAADVGKWFDEEMESPLMDSVIAKYPKWESEKVAALVSKYRDSFCELTKYSLPQSKQVSAMLSNAYGKITAEFEATSEMCEYVGERLKKLAERHANTESLESAV